MEYFGLVAFILVIIYMDHSGKLKKLEHKVKVLNRKEKEVSKVIKGLMGKQCIITTSGIIASIGKQKFECSVIDVDDDWLKIIFVDRKGVEKTVIIRVDSLENIELKD